MSLEGKALGDINQARVAREYYLPLHISTTMSSNPITLNVVIIPVSDANTDQMDINIISVQAQEQLQLAVKAQCTTYFTSPAGSCSPLVPATTKMMAWHPTMLCYSNPLSMDPGWPHPMAALDPLAT